MRCSFLDVVALAEDIQRIVWAVVDVYATPIECHEVEFCDS